MVLIIFFKLSIKTAVPIYVQLYYFSIFFNILLLYITLFNIFIRKVASPFVAFRFANMHGPR